MPLPAGFKVNGTKCETTVLAPPRVKKIMMMLDQLPSDELLTSMEVGIRAGQTIGGSWANHPALSEYREKIDNRFFWGSLKGIKKLRQQLAEPEESNDQN